MSPVERLGKFLVRWGEAKPKDTRKLDEGLAARAASIRSNSNAGDTATIHELVREAWKQGQTIALHDACYGPAHWKGGEEFSDKQFPYYFFLAGLVRSQQLRTILEIGTHYGGSCLSMSHGLAEQSDAKIVTVDISDLNPVLHTTPGITKLVGDANSEAMIKKIVLCFGETPIDLLYVDAAHTFSSTIANLGLYITLLRPRFAVIDDILLNDGMRAMWNVMSATYGAHAVNCVDIVPEIRGRNVGFGLIKLR